MTPDQVDFAATELLQAEIKGEQIGLLSQRYPGMTLDDAYAVQSRLVAKKQELGRSVIGWKIGLTSRAMQMALNIETPDSGVLLDDMLFPDKAVIPATRFIQPRVEAEIAFVMRSPLAGDCTRADVLAATDYVAPAIEILDTRVMREDPKTGQTRIVTDTVADNAANAGLVLGATQHSVMDFDLRWIGAIVARDGTVEETGLGAGVLNDPVLGVVWLARRMASYNARIEPGHIVLSGSFIRPLECPPGCRIDADFGPFGSVNVNFAVT